MRAAKQPATNICRPAATRLQDAHRSTRAILRPGWGVRLKRPGRRSNEDLARRFVEQCQVTQMILPRFTVIELSCAEGPDAATLKVDAGEDRGAVRDQQPTHSHHSSSACCHTRVRTSQRPQKAFLNIRHGTSLKLTRAKFQLPSKATNQWRGNGAYDPF